MLLRRKARVTLLDAWGPGNSRASSGGETRLIRALYGTHRIYTQMAVRAGWNRSVTRHIERKDARRAAEKSWTP